MATMDTVAPTAGRLRRKAHVVGMGSTSKAALIRLAALAIMLGAIWVGLMPLTAVPVVVPASAPATRFSAERAMTDVRTLAARPRPVGSSAQAAARDYLVSQISALGLTPEVQRATVVRSGRTSAIAAVENVMVRLAGRESGRAVLITGHYDSVPTGPGVYDCANCAATALETLRVINSGPQLKNDVIFLFTDGEEVETMGARAFAQQHPWARDVALTIVYEGYGSTGADILYGTGRTGGWASAQALATGGLATGITGYSFINDIMAPLGGSSSDLEAFVAEGVPGLAFISLSLNTAAGYHTWDDNLANFDPRTLQSHGDHAVALVRHFGDMALSGIPGTPNAVYFSLLPGITVQYSRALALPLAAGALVLYLAVLVVGAWRRRLSLAGVLVGAFGWLLSLAGSLACATAIWITLRRLNTNLHAFRIGTYDAGLYLLAFVALAAAITLGLFALARRRFTPASLTAGALAWWAILGLLFALAMPGVSYVCTWPLVAALLLAGWSFLRPVAPAGTATFAWVIPAATALVLITPAIYFVAILAGRIEGVLGVPVVGAPLLFVLLLLGLMLPLTELLPRRGRASMGFVTLVLLCAATGLLALAAVRSAPSVERPATNMIAYRLESPTGGADRAAWITLNDSRGGRGTRAQLDAWTAQFFASGGQAATFNPWTDDSLDQEFPALLIAAPVVPIAHGGLSVESDERTASGRQLRLHIALAPQVLDGQIVLSAGRSMNEIVVNGRQLELDGQAMAQEPLQINFNGRFPDGITLEITGPGDDTISVALHERTPGLPAVPGLAVEPRPANMIPAPFNFASDSTLVLQSWTMAAKSQ